MSSYRYFAHDFFLGGDADLRQVRLQPQHLAQADESQNAALWQHLPLQPSSYIAGHLAMYSVFSGPPATPQAFLDQVVEAEISYFRMKVAAIRTIWSDLAPEKDFFQRVCQRQEASSVRPLSAAVASASRQKEGANRLYGQGDYKAALVAYAECLADLMPWYASPLLLTAAQSYDSGLAQLESSLWNNVYITNLKVDSPYSTQKTVAEVAFTAVHFMRYAPHKMLYKARYRYIQTLETNPALHPASSPLSVELQKECLREMVHTTSMDWAHRRCDTEHVCFSERFRRKKQEWEKENGVD